MENRVEHYAEDRERLLLDLRRKGLRAWVPAELVREAILHCDWRIERVMDMEAGLLSISCPEQQVVKVPRDFGRRLRVPETARAVLNETLALELGRIRLHQDARHYARVFLVPLVTLMSRFPMRRLLQLEDPAQGWTQLQRLADEFQVTTWFMGSVLEMYGLAKIEKRRRLLEMQPRAHELQRRFAFVRPA